MKKETIHALPVLIIQQQQDNFANVSQFLNIIQASNAYYAKQYGERLANGQFFAIFWPPKLWSLLLLSQPLFLPARRRRKKGYLTKSQKCYKNHKTTKQQI